MTSHIFSGSGSHGLMWPLSHRYLHLGPQLFYIPHAAFLPLIVGAYQCIVPGPSELKVSLEITRDLSKSASDVYSCFILSVKCGVDKARRKIKFEI